MSWPTYVWAILWAILVGLGLWFGAQTFWRRAHFPALRASCIEQGGVITEIGDGFSCSYDFTGRQRDSP